jgi:drug/metabolite transporter (DMT)-like permease
MEYFWILASILAALFQAIRLAALKELNRHVSVPVATYVRVLFGLPVLLAYTAALLWTTGASLPPVTPRFLIFSALTALGQYAGTALIVRLFQLGNFAVGTMLAKADVVVTAIVGSILFSEAITAGGWVAIVVTVAGVLLASAGRFPASAWRSGGESLAVMLFGPPTRIGLLIGAVNAASYLMLREAILDLDPAASPLVRSAYAATMMLVMALFLVGGWLIATDRPGLRRLASHIPLCLFVGVMSAIGTLFWFLASALTNASYVAAVAQIQIVFALAISRWWFREAIRPLELAGIATILAGIVLFRFV